MMWCGKPSLDLSLWVKFLQYLHWKRSVEGPLKCQTARQLDEDEWWEAGSTKLRGASSGPCVFTATLCGVPDLPMKCVAVIEAHLITWSLAIEATTHQAITKKKPHQHALRCGKGKFCALDESRGLLPSWVLSSFNQPSAHHVGRRWLYARLWGRAVSWLPYFPFNHPRLTKQVWLWIRGLGRRWLRRYRNRE